MTSDPVPGRESRPRRGERYVVTDALETIALTHWKAPFTGGERVQAVPGLEFVVDRDPPDEAIAVVAAPVDYARWERLLVSDEDRTHPQYDGYSLSIRIDKLASHCRPVASST